MRTISREGGTLYVDSSSNSCSDYGVKAIKTIAIVVAIAAIAYGILVLAQGKIGIPIPFDRLIGLAPLLGGVAIALTVLYKCAQESSSAPEEDVRRFIEHASSPPPNLTTPANNTVITPSLTTNSGVSTARTPEDQAWEQDIQQKRQALQARQRALQESAPKEAEDAARSAAERESQIMATGVADAEERVRNFAIHSAQTLHIQEQLLHVGNPLLRGDTPAHTSPSSTLPTSTTHSTTAATH